MRCSSVPEASLRCIITTPRGRHGAYAVCSPRAVRLDGSLRVALSKRRNRKFDERCKFQLVKCCTRDAPDATFCLPTKWYENKQGCNGQFLELADSKEDKPSEEFLNRLNGASPPPSPPPSPEPPPPPSPPAPPPPPRPPVAISLAEGRAIAKKIERRFCDAVRTKQSQTLIHA